MRRILYGLAVVLFFSAVSFAAITTVSDFTEFNDAIFNAVDNDEIAFSSNIVVDAPVNALTANGITLFGDNFVFDGAGEYFLFDVGQDISFFISSITLQNFANNAGSNIAYGGVLSSSGGAINIYNSTISHSSASAAGQNVYGGAIYNDSSSTLTIVNSGFYFNTAYSQGATAYGGAIYNAGLLNIIADGGDVVFEGNTAQGISNAIYTVLGSSIVLTASVGNSIIFNDAVVSPRSSADFGYIIISGSDSNLFGEVVFQNSVINNTLIISSAVVRFGKFSGILVDGSTETYIVPPSNGKFGSAHSDDKGSIYLYGNSILSFVNGQAGDYAEMMNFYVEDNARLDLEVDLAALKIDFLAIQGTCSGEGSLDLSKLKILSEFTGGRTSGDFRVFYNGLAADYLNGQSFFANDASNNMYFVAAISSQSINISLYAWADDMFQVFVTTSTDEKRVYTFFYDTQTYTALAGYDYTVGAGTLSIVGIGNLISGSNKVRLFLLEDMDRMLTIEDVILADGFSSAGGALYNLGIVELSSVTLKNNVAKSTTDFSYGGAFYNASSATIIDSQFNSNSVQSDSGAYGGAVYNAASGVMNIYNTDFIGNKAQGEIAYGGAVYTNSEMNFFNSSFYYNVVSGTTSSGGAVYNDGGIVNIVSDGKDVIFYGNTANGVSNAVCNANGGVLNLNAGATNIVLYDAIVSEGNNNIININSSAGGFANSGIVAINADMSGFGNNNSTSGNTVNIYSGTFMFGPAAVFFNDAEVHFSTGSTFDLQNGKIDSISASNLNFDGAGDVNMKIDVSLKDSAADNIKNSTAAFSAATKLVITDIHLLSEVSHVNDIVNIQIAADAATMDSLSLADSLKQVAGNVLMYNVSYSSVTGMLTFGYTRDYNPAIFIAPIGMIIGGYLEQLYSYEQAFKAADETVISKTPQGLWIRPYGFKESLELLDGLKIDNTGYGVYVGYDTDSSEFLGGGVSFSVYGAFKTSDKTYTGASINQQGGLAGVAATFVSGKFFASLTGNFGITNEHGEATLSGVTENFMMYTRGIAVKTGYCLPISENEKLKLVPALVLSLSDMSMAPYETSNGVELISNGFSPLTAEPQIRFVADFSSSWYGYANASAFINTGKTDFTAGGIQLPEMKVKPYVQYSIGTGKALSSVFSVRAELMGRSLGRTGYGGQVNIQYKMGSSSGKLVPLSAILRNKSNEKN